MKSKRTLIKLAVALLCVMGLAGACISNGPEPDGVKAIRDSTAARMDNLASPSADAVALPVQENE